MTSLPEHMSDWEKRRLLVDTVCALTTDRQTLEIAKWWTMEPNGRAAAHLNHYLDGKGGDLNVDLAALIREDLGVRKTVTTAILASLNAGKLSGTVPVPQMAYTNRDWLYALGGINIEWKALPPTMKDRYSPAVVEIKFRNKYRWHPYDQRFTQSLHAAAFRLKKKGAAEFWMVGTGTAPIR